MGPPKRWSARAMYEIWNYHDTTTLARIKAGTVIEEDMFGDNSLNFKMQVPKTLHATFA